MKYTDLIFDLYGTLVDIHTDETEHAWEKTALYLGYYGIDYTWESLKTDCESEFARRESLLKSKSNSYPDIPFDQVLTELICRTGYPDSANQLAVSAAQIFRVASTQYIRLYPGVADALQRLRNQGFRLWLLSNAQSVFTNCELRLLGLTQAFDGIYLSSDFACRKPDPRFFRALLQQENLNPHQCLMIGNDRSTDIAGAKSLRLATLYLHTNLTPSSQRAAHPCRIPDPSSRRKHYEFEGTDWNELPDVISAICK